jgi:hypothetical protein
MAPGCINGELVVRASGFAEKKERFSSGEDSFADVILDREFEVEIGLQDFSGNKIGDNAVVSFVSEDKTVTAVSPGYTSIKLSEGEYEIRAYVYGNSSITIPASTKRHCQEVGSSGLLGLFGGTEEKCFDIDVPATTIEYALIGGGVGEEYLLEDELQKGKLTLNVHRLPKPNSLEDLQYNFASFEDQKVSVEYS